MKNNAKETLNQLNERIEMAQGMISSINTSNPQSMHQALVAIAHCTIGLTILARDSFEEHANE